MWLVGPTSDSAIYNQLPTVRQVLSRLFYLTSRPADGVTSRREQIRSVLQEVQVAWDKSRIPTIQPKSSTERIESIHDKWKVLHKHASRGDHWPIKPAKPSPPQVKNENAFIETLDTLFDIADPQAIDKIQIEEDREFLIDQRGERKMFIGRIDSKQTRHEKKELELQIARYNRLQKREEKLQAVKMKLEELRKNNTAVEAQPESEESESGSELDENANETDPTFPPPRKRGRVSIATPELVASLDRTGTSDRRATVLLAAHLKALKKANVLTVVRYPQSCGRPSWSPKVAGLNPGPLVAGLNPGPKVAGGHLGSQMLRVLHLGPGPHSRVRHFVFWVPKCCGPAILVPKCCGSVISTNSCFKNCPTRVGIEPGTFPFVSEDHHH